MKKKLFGVGCLVTSLCALTPLEMVRFTLHRDGGGKYLRKRGIKKITNGTDTTESIQMTDQDEYQRTNKKRIEEFIEKIPENRVQVIARDGINLTGFYYTHQDCHRWVIAFHGYRANHYEILNCGYTSNFYDMRFNVLTPDQRASGESGGTYIGMGWLERLDVLTWTEWILGNDPEAEIVLYGISMGAATVLAASGEELSPQVKVIISDSGYSSMSDVVQEIAKEKFHIPSFLTITLAGKVSACVAGYDFKEVDILTQVRKSTLPILFFHGTEDSMVNHRNLKKLYDAATHCEKEMHSVEGADHVCSSYVLGFEYWNIIRSFIDKHMK